jgi:uncharacterized membrane protein
MRRFKWSLMVVYVTWCAYVWRSLPARFPIHFNALGLVDRWSEKSVAMWGMLPVVLLGVLLLLELLTAWTVRHPRLWNVPEKPRFLAMSDSQRAPIYNELRNLMDTICVGLVLLFAAIHYTMYSVAKQQYTRMPFIMIFAGLAFALGALVYTFMATAKIKHIILSADVPSPEGSTG